MLEKREVLGENSVGNSYLEVLVESSGGQFGGEVLQGLFLLQKSKLPGRQNKLQENQNIILPSDYVKRNEWNEVFALFPNILFYCQ